MASVGYTCGCAMLRCAALLAARLSRRARLLSEVRACHIRKAPSHVVRSEGKGSAEKRRGEEQRWRGEEKERRSGAEKLRGEVQVR